MSDYLKEADILWPVDARTHDVRHSLPVSTYTVGTHPVRGFFLKEIDNFEIKGKLYGDTTKHTERILDTFEDRPSTTGVLLNGEKGSGKTMLAKRVSEKGRERGISTIVINSPFCGDQFNTFIQAIDEPCIILFDEFEKVFDDEQQEAILTLLDGVYPTKKLFILTCNDQYKVNMHMRNRPGRLYYMIDYVGLDESFIEEYCIDNLINKDNMKTVTRLPLLFSNLNFDMLKAIVEEMNRYGETAQQVLKMLNAKPYSGNEVNYDVNITYDGIVLDASKFNPDKFYGIPLAAESIGVMIRGNYKEQSKPSVTYGSNQPVSASLRGMDSFLEDDFPESDDIHFNITQQDIVRHDLEKGIFQYATKADGKSVLITFAREKKIKPYNYLDTFADF